MKIPVRVSLSLDPAVTDKARSDFSGFIINMTDAAGKWYIYEAEAFKGRPSEVVDRFVQYALAYRPAAISIESNAAQILYKELITPRLRDENIFTPITEYKPPNTINKRAKIEKLQPRFKKGLIVIRRGLRELIRQLDEFPENDHDDLLDSLCQQDLISRPPRLHELYGSSLDEDNFDLEEENAIGKRPSRPNAGYSTPSRR